MNTGRKWLQAHAYTAHVAALLMMLAAPVWMYLAAQHAIGAQTATATQLAITAQPAASAWIYPPLALFILANLVELFIP